MIKQRWGVNVLRIKETPKMRAKVKKKITIIIIIIIIAAQNIIFTTK